MQSKNAIGNLINKYKAVLKKCTLINTFGSLAVASMLVCSLGVGFGVDTTFAKSLSSAVDGENSPNEVVTSGILDEGKSATFGGINGIAFVRDYADKDTPTILTLTGLGDANGILSNNDIRVENTAVLYLGIAGSPIDTQINGQLRLSGAHQFGAGNPLYTSGIVQYTHVDIDDGIIVEESARLYINDGGSITTDTLAINYNSGGSNISATPTVYVGAYGNDGSGYGSLNITGAGGLSMSDGQIYVGNGGLEVTKITGIGERPALLVGSVRNAAHAGTVNVTGEDGINFSGTGGSFFVSHGTLTAQKVVISANNGRLRVGDDAYSHTEGIVHITGADGISLSNGAYVNVEYGTLNTTDLALSNEAFVRVGTGSYDSHLNISDAKSYDISIFDKQTYYDDGDIKEYSLYNKVAVGESGVFNIDNTLTLTAGADAFDTVGTVSADSIIVNGSPLTIAGGTLLSRGDMSANGITITSSTREDISSGEIRQVNNAGRLELSGTSASQLNSAVTVNGTGASLTVSSGAWTAHGDIQIQSGNLIVSGGSLNTSAVSVSIDSTGGANLSGGTLTASLADFGTVDFSQAEGAQFSDAGASIATNLLGSNTTTLVLTGFGSSQVLFESQYLAFINELSADIFGIGSTVRNINVEGVTLLIPSLNDMSASAPESARINPTGTILAGNFSHATEAIFGGILANETAPGSKIEDSQVSVAGAKLTLTGLSQLTGGVFSSGSMTVSGGGELVLGYNDGTYLSPENTVFNGKITATGAGSTVKVEHTHTTVQDTITVTNGATLNIENTGAVSTSAPIVLDGGIAHVQGSLTASHGDGISLSKQAELMANGVVSSTDFSINNSTLHVDGGSVTIENDLIFENNSSIDLNNGATMHIESNFTTNADVFSDTAGAGKIAVGTGTRFIVDDILSLNAPPSSTSSTLHFGGIVETSTLSVSASELNFTSGNLRVLGGAIEASTINLSGGSIELGTGLTEYVLNASMNITHANSTLAVSAGTWETTSQITVQNGTLRVHSGALLDINGDITLQNAKLEVTGTLQANGQLTANAGSSIDISGGSVRADLNDFGSVDLSAASGAQFEKNTSGGVQVGMTTSNASTIELLGFGQQVALSPGAYNALLEEILSEITLDSNASLSILGITFDPNLFTLSDIATNINEPETAIKAGTLSKDFHATFARIEPFNGVNDAAVNSTGAVLTLTGHDTGSFGTGNLDVLAGTLNLGLAGTSPAQTTLDGHIMASGADSKVFVRGTQATIAGGVNLESGAIFQVQTDGTLLTKNLQLSNAGTKLTVLGSLHIDNEDMNAVGATISDGATLESSGTTVLNNISADAAQLHVGAGTVDITGESGATFSNGGGIIMQGGTLSVSGESGITLDTASLDIQGGIVQSTAFYAKDSSVHVGTGGNLILPDNYTFENSDISIAGDVYLAGNVTLSAENLGSSKDTFDIQAGGTLHIQGALDFDASKGAFTTEGTVQAQDITIANGNIAIQQGTLSSAGGTISGNDMTVTGGTFELASGTGAHTVQNALSVSSGAVIVSGGAWTTEKALNTTGGALSIDGGTLTANAQVSIGAGASLSVGNGVLDVRHTNLGIDAGAGTVELGAGGTVLANKDDFATSGSVNKVFSSEVGSSVVLYGYSGTINYTNYENEVANLLDNVFENDPSKRGGSLTLEGYTSITGIDSLSDITQNNLGINLGEQSIGAGTLNALNTSVTASHVTVNGTVDIATVTNGSTLTLTGIGAEGVVSDGVTLHAAGGHIQIGSNYSATAAQTTVNGDINITAAGTVTTQNTHVTVSGNTTITDGSMTVTSGAAFSANKDTRLGSSGKLHIENTASYFANNLIMEDGALITVGDTTTATIGGTLSAQAATLQGGTLYFDPAWQNNASIENASSGAILSFTNGIDGNLVMGQNSFVVVGDADNTWAQEAFARSGLTWGENATSAAMFIKTQQNLSYAQGSVLVNGALTSAPTALTGGTVVFGENSLLLVDALELSTRSSDSRYFDAEDAALFVTGAAGEIGKLAVADSAKLYIENGRNGIIGIVGNITINDALDDGNGGTVDGGGWSVNNIGTTSALIGINDAWYDDVNDVFVVDMKQLGAAGNFPLLDPTMATLVDNVIASGFGLSVDDANMGVRFISRAVDDRYIGTTDTTLAAATIEGAAQLAAIGAVPSTTFNVSQSMVGSIVERTSLANPVASQLVSTKIEDKAKTAPKEEEGIIADIDKKQHGFALWAMPLYSSSIASGFKAGNFETGYTTDFAGLTLGGDVTLDNFMRFGVAFNVGGGATTSSGDFNETSNDFDFWGISLYGGVQKHNFSLMLDVGYSVINNELQQKMPASMSMADLTGSVHSSAWTAGLRLEYLWKTPYLDIAPYVGVRYTALNTSRYDVESNGKVYDVAAANQSIVTIPAGISLSKEITTDSGWLFKPRVNLGMVWASGDLDARTNVTIPSVMGGTDLHLRTMDEFSFSGGVGLEAKKGDFSLGVNYNTLISEHKTDHMVFGFVRYEFGAPSEKGTNAGSLLPTVTSADGAQTATAARQNAQSASGAKQGGELTLLGAAASGNTQGDSAPTLLGGGTSTGGSGDVHQLAAVTVHGFDIGSGTYGIGGETLRTLPNATGTITGALKSMSNVQFSNADQSSVQGGEIAPPRISIYGSKPYENNFRIDGLNVSNTFNPSGFEGSETGNHVAGPNYLATGGGDTDIFYDVELIERIDIYTNNVPAKYGNFTGGVINATLRDPKKDKWHFKLSGKMTSSSWYEVRGADSFSETAANQPEFDIYSFSGTAEGPITDNLSVLLGYTNTQSFIPLDFEDESGNVSKKNQYRLSQNFFAKFVATPTDDLTLRLDASYAPYKDLRWREKWPNSEQTLSNEALRLAFQAEYDTDIGNFDFKMSYLRSGFSTEAASNFLRQDRTTSERHGGYGSRTVDKTEFATTFDYSTPLIETSWLKWKLDTGVSINVTGVSMWAQDVTTDIFVEGITYQGRDANLSTFAYYPETKQYNTMTTAAFYAQLELKYDRVTLTPGFRIDTDSLTNNVDISPRLKLEVDIFDNKMLRFVAGYIRYYGSALREYAFKRYRPFENEQVVTYTDAVGGTETIYSLGSDRDYDISGLKTPYSDEYTVGVLGKVWDIDYSLDFTYREHKNQLVSEEVGQVAVLYNGKIHNQSLYELTNKGNSQYHGVTLTLGRRFELGKWGNHYVGFGATYSATKTFNGAYAPDAGIDSRYGFTYHGGGAYYNGELVARNELPADDFNANFTLTLNIQSSFFDNRLRINWLNRWKPDSYGLMLDSRYDKDTPHGSASQSNIEESNEWLTGDGVFVKAYREGTIKGGLISDISIEYDVWKEEDFTLGVSLDVYNIFNANLGVAASDPSGQSEGTSFWVGVYTTF